MLTFFPSRTIAIEIFGFAVHWYGIMYLLSFLLALVLLPRLQRERGLRLTRDDWASVVTSAVLGVILGGRLGYVLFYEPAYFASHPSDIIAVWKGGMSSHGGFIGVSLAIFIYTYRHSIDIRKLGDIVVVPVAIGLALGRFGNFINQELYGTVTNLPWGIAIPGVEGFRHPTQIYAVLKNLILAAVCFSYFRYHRPIVPGRTFALFLILYSIFRFLVEYLRDQEYGFIHFGILSLSRGQLLTIPLFLIGLLLWRWLGVSRTASSS